MHINKYNWLISYLKALITAYFIEHSSKEDFFNMVEIIIDIDNIIDMHETVEDRGLFIV